jgi:hypothetical protein
VLSPLAISFCGVRPNPCAACCVFCWHFDARPNAGRQTAGRPLAHVESVSCCQPL